MARTLPVNADFDTALGQLGTPDQTHAIRQGIQAALAVTPGQTLNVTDYPILGFYFTSTTEQFLSYFVTPGRFIRYEVAAGRSLTVTVPLDRVSRVVEEAGTDELLVTVELDADAVGINFETESAPQPAAGPGVEVGRGVARQTRTAYSIAATGRTEVLRLAAFSRAIRSSVGL